MPSAKTGLLLINLGTPEAPTPGAVRPYLRQFLSDPRVLDINAVGRFLLLNLFILPFRPKKSAEAYAKVWTPQGSPLLVESEALTQKVSERTQGEFEVALGMRYGEPSIEGALRRLWSSGVTRVVVLPLYPQYSSASTGSSIEEVLRVAAAEWNTSSITTAGEFYAHPAFIRAFAEVGRPELERFRPDHILFSYHGLPERHMRKSDLSGGAHCLASSSCCDRIVEANKRCYRAQCYATTRALAAALSLRPEEHSVSFQSRLGRDPWIKPYTDLHLVDLAKRGVKRLAVFCPAFVADCLETLEEVRLRAKETFVEAGGDDLHLVPSLNAHPAWVDAVITLAREARAGH